MAIKNIIVKGIGFDDTGDSETRYVPTHGFGDFPGGGGPPATYHKYERLVTVKVG